MAALEPWQLHSPPGDWPPGYFQIGGSRNAVLLDAVPSTAVLQRDGEDQSVTSSTNLHMVQVIKENGGQYTILGSGDPDLQSSKQPAFVFALVEESSAKVLDMVTVEYYRTAPDEINEQILAVATLKPTPLNALRCVCVTTPPPVRFGRRKLTLEYTERVDTPEGPEDKPFPFVLGYQTEALLKLAKMFNAFAELTEEQLKLPGERDGKTGSRKWFSALGGKERWSPEAIWGYRLLLGPPEDAKLGNDIGTWQRAIIKGEDAKGVETEYRVRLKIGGATEKEWKPADKENSKRWEKLWWWDFNDGKNAYDEAMAALEAAKATARRVSSSIYWDDPGTSGPENAFGNYTGELKTDIKKQAIGNEEEVAADGDMKPHPAIMRVLPHSLRFEQLIEIDIPRNVENPLLQWSDEMVRKMTKKTVPACLEVSRELDRVHGGLHLLQAYKLVSGAIDPFGAGYLVKGETLDDGEPQVRRADQRGRLVSTVRMSGMVPRAVSDRTGLFLPVGERVRTSVMEQVGGPLLSKMTRVSNEAIMALAAFSELLVYDAMGAEEVVRRNASQERVRVRRSIIDSPLRTAQRRVEAALPIIGELMEKVTYRPRDGVPLLVGTRGGLDAAFLLRHFDPWVTLRTGQGEDQARWTEEFAGMLVRFSRALQAFARTKSDALTPLRFPFMAPQTLSLFPSQAGDASLLAGALSEPLQALRDGVVVQQQRDVAGGVPTRLNLLKMSAEQAAARVVAFSPLIPLRAGGDINRLFRMLLEARPWLVQKPDVLKGAPPLNLEDQEGCSPVCSTHLPTLLTGTWGARCLDRTYVSALDGADGAAPDMQEISQMLSKIRLDKTYVKNGALWTEPRDFYAAFGAGVGQGGGVENNPAVSEMRVWVASMGDAAAAIVRQNKSGSGLADVRFAIRLESVARDKFIDPYVLRVAPGDVREIRVPVVTQLTAPPAAASATAASDLYSVASNLRAVMGTLEGKDPLGEEVAQRLREVMFTSERVYQALTIVAAHVSGTETTLPFIEFLMGDGKPVVLQTLHLCMLIAFGMLRNVTPLKPEFISAGGDSAKAFFSDAKDNFEKASRKLKVLPLCEACGVVSA